MNKIAVFLFALITGMITRSGVMTLEQMIWSAWDSASDSLLFSLSPDLYLCTHYWDYRLRNRCILHSCAFYPWFRSWE